MHGAAAGDYDATYRAAWNLQNKGRWEDAERLWRQSVDRGDSPDLFSWYETGDAHDHLVRALMKLDRVEEAILVRRQQVDEAPSRSSLEALAGPLIRAERLAEAAHIKERLLVEHSSGSWWALIDFVEEHGMAESSQRIRATAAALGFEVDDRKPTGNRTEPVRDEAQLRRSALGGSPAYVRPGLRFDDLTAYRERTGRNEEAHAVSLAGLNPDGTTGLPWWPA